MSMDYSGGTVFSGEGYANNNTLVLEASTMTASGATVYATQGYQNGTQYAEVQSGTVTETSSTIEISEGYVQAATFSKGGGGYPVPSGSWSTMTNNQTYYAGEHGAFVRIIPTSVQILDLDDCYFIIYVNGVKFISFGVSMISENYTLSFDNMHFFIPPNSSFYVDFYLSGGINKFEYCDAILQS